MKTLSIQQPWASLICAGIKDVENRTWKAAQVPGRILIHASSKKVTKNFFAGISEDLVSFINNDIGFGNFPELDTLPTSAIVGYVTVTGFEEGKVDSVWADEGPDVIKWKLEDAWLFDEPILNVKGKLNLFDYNDIDEENLPPAHKVVLSDVVVSDNEEDVFIPCEINTFEKIKTGEFKGIELYLTHYLIDALCVEESFSMKPFKTVTLECGNKYLKFELEKDSGIYNLPDPQDETRPYMIYYPDGTELPWMIVQFMFGKKLDEGEYNKICGGMIYNIVPEIEKMIKEQGEIIKFNVSKDVFNDIVSGKQRVFEIEITPGKQDLYCLLNEDGSMKEINGVVQLRKYNAIQFVNKIGTYTCKIENADVVFEEAGESDPIRSYNTKIVDGDYYDFDSATIVYYLGDEIKPE